MALTQDQIDQLVMGAEADLLTCGVVGWKVNKPTQNMTAALQLEDIARESGLEHDYGKALKKIVKEDDEEGLSNEYLLAHATPFQRTKAFLQLQVE